MVVVEMINEHNYRIKVISAIIVISIIVILSAASAFFVVSGHYKALFQWGAEYNDMVYIPEGEPIFNFTGISKYGGEYGSTYVIIDRTIPNTTIKLRIVEPTDYGAFIPIAPKLKHNSTYYNNLHIGFFANPCVQTKIIGEFQNESGRWFEVDTVDQMCACF